MRRWPEYGHDGGDPENDAKRRQATSVQGLVMHRWRLGYAVDQAELRKPDGRVIPLDSKGNQQ